MRHGKVPGGMLAVLALIACAGLVLAQAPDWRAPAAEGAPAAGGARPGRPGRGAERVPAGVGPMLMLMLVQGAGQAGVTNADAGVDLKLTVDDPQEVAVLQWRVERAVANLESMVERLAQRAQEGAPAGRQARGLLGLLAGGDAAISSKNIEDGVVVSFTSDKPEVVQALQQNMPQWVAQAQERGDQARQLQQRARAMREALALLADDKVAVEVEETEQGITVNVTSEDPELAKQIKEKLADYFRNRKEFAQGVGELPARPRGRANAPMGAEGGQVRRRRVQGGRQP